MDLKTYRGNSMADALAQVKRDLGTQAVILHARAAKIGGLWGFGGRNIFEITATSTAAPIRAQGSRLAPTPAVAAANSSPAASAAAPVPRPDRSADRRPSSPPSNAAKAGPSSAGGTSQSSTLPPPAPSASAAVVPSPIVTRSIGVPVPRPASCVRPNLSTPVSLAPIDAAAQSTLESELASIKRLVGQMYAATSRSAVQLRTGPGSPAAGVLSLGGLPDALMSFYLQLLDRQVTPDLAESLVAAVRAELNPAEATDPAIVRETGLRHLAQRLPCVGAALPLAKPSGREPFVVAVIGPTGVGKTTTIAKLAATFKLRQQRRVGLITCDTYRIAAVDQLRTYANIIGLPLKVALTPDELAAARRTLSDCDVLLIDTAGRSHNDAKRLDELQSFLAAARPHQTHLALSLAASESVLRRAAECFRTLTPDRLLLTKLDECEHPGVIANLLSHTQLPASFITTGQEVPDQIDQAQPDRLARLVLGLRPDPQTVA